LLCREDGFEETAARWFVVSGVRRAPPILIPCPHRELEADVESRAVTVERKFNLHSLSINVFPTFLVNSAADKLSLRVEAFSLVMTTRLFIAARVRLRRDPDRRQAAVGALWNLPR